MAETGKKRKRAADGSSKPSKKAALATPPAPVPDVTVSIIPNTDDWAPIVAFTPGLSIPGSISLQPYTKRRKNAPQRAGHSGSIATKELLLNSSAHPTIEYTGREDEIGGVDSLLKHYVGVFDPKTGKLEVMEARKMTVRAVVRSHQAPASALEERGSTANMRELRNDLGQTFGTKKAKKAIASLTENAISPIKSAQGPNSTPRKIDAAARLVLESMEGATKAMATREELEAAINDAKPRPKANLAAENVGDVYTVESLIGLDIMKLVPVKEWQDSVKAKKEVITSSKFVAHRLLKVSTDVQRMRVLRYLLCLLDFFGASKPKGKAGRMVPRRDDLRNALTGIPEAVVENIRRKFSDGGIMLKKHVDLLITHVCALALLVDNFEVDMFDLKEDLKLEIKEISQYFHEIGSRIVAAGVNETKKLGLDKAAAAQHKFAKLKLPLDFPKAKFARKG